MPNPNCPFPPEACEAINAALQSCSRCREMLGVRASLGDDVTSDNAQNEDNAAFFSKLKSIYFPDRP